MATLIKSPRIDTDSILLPHASPKVSNAIGGTPVRGVPEPAYPDAGAIVEERSGIDETNEQQIAVLQASLNRELAAIDVLRQSGHEQGYAAGYQEGVEAGRQAAKAAADKDIDARLALIDEMLQQLRLASDGVLTHAESVIAAIVFEAVCKIVGRDLATMEGAIAAIRQIVARIGTEACLTVGLAPSDFAWFKEKGLAVGALPPSLAEVITEDPSVALGGCRIRVANGEIDGRIETQFRNFAQSLKDAIRQR